jgi:hypothetical protein
MATGESLVKGFTLYDIARGVAGSKLVPWSKTGFAVSIGTTQFTLWNPATEYVWPTIEQQMEVTSSDNTQDLPGGTGALTVRISYLNLAGVEKTDTVTLNGTAVIATTAVDIYRVNAFRVATTGTDGKAKGTITLRHLTNIPIYSQIAAGYTRGRNQCYTVPAGKVLYVSSIAFSVGASAAGKSMRFTTHATYDNISGTALTAGVFFMPYSEVELMDGAYTKLLEIPTRLPAGTDIKVSGIGESGATCTSILRGWLETL